MIREFSILLERHVDDYDKARLLTAASRHSADWLHAVPITSCGLQLDDDAHMCCCGAQVDVRDSHALSCKQSSNHLIRHKQLLLFTSGISATREPAGILRAKW